MASWYILRPFYEFQDCSDVVRTQKGKSVEAREWMDRTKNVASKFCLNISTIIGVSAKFHSERHLSSIVTDTTKPVSSVILYKICIYHTLIWNMCCPSQNHYFLNVYSSCHQLMQTFNMMAPYTHLIYYSLQSVFLFRLNNRHIIK